SIGTPRPPWPGAHPDQDDAQPAAAEHDEPAPEANLRWAVSATEDPDRPEACRCGTHRKVKGRGPRPKHKCPASGSEHATANANDGGVPGPSKSRKPSSVDSRSPRARTTGTHHRSCRRCAQTSWNS